MDWLYGVFQCAPLSPTCVIDWDAVSAVATALAVVFAWLAIQTENRHRTQERNRADAILMDEVERKREDRRSRARRLAKIFDRELWEASAELLAVRRLVVALKPQNEAEFKSVFKNPLRPEVFAMHERFVDQLDVFPDELAIAVVNNMTNWRSIPIFSEGFASQPDVAIYKMRPKILAHVDEVLELFGETKLKLEPYFADLPGVQVLTVEQVREMNDAAAREKTDELNKGQ